MLVVLSLINGILPCTRSIKMAGKQSDVILKVSLHRNLILRDPHEFSM